MSTVLAKKNNSSKNTHALKFLKFVYAKNPTKGSPTLCVGWIIPRNIQNLDDQ